MSIEIYAGITYGEFRDIIEQNGKIITVYSRDDFNNHITIPSDYDGIDSLVLCYIYDSKDFKRAYFSKTMEVWGDDWNDSPYEHNSGEPYEYEIKVEFTTNLYTPVDRSYGDCYYSVKRINDGEIPWLSSDPNL